MILSVLFVANAYYNFNEQFLAPIKDEYRQVRTFIEKNYDQNINTVYFIQPHEDFFVKKFCTCSITQRRVTSSQQGRAGPFHRRADGYDLGRKTLRLLSLK
jgi:hypothetical protein